jgi:SAM-dependent methyltransferase
MSSIDSSLPPSPWEHWPEWTREDAFQTEHFKFHSSVSKYDGKTTGEDSIAILKHKQFIDIYRQLLADKPTSIFEIGFFQGGMPLFMADMAEASHEAEATPLKIVGIDYYQPTPELSGIIERSGLSDTIKLYGDILQDDTTKIKGILDQEFPNPLDLIIDDCSHQYRETKLCFESFFSYLKPGGKYVIEDWGWQHWPGEPWQTIKSPFHGKPSMSNLLIELMMTMASRSDLITRIDILSSFCVVITRGEALQRGDQVILERTYLTAGRKFVPM